MTAGAAAPRFDWTSLLEYAEARVDCTSQFMRRLIINRAYYAAFHVAQAGLRDRGVAEADSRFHRQLWDEFAQARGVPPRDARAWRVIAELGGLLQYQRTRADYEDDATWSAEECVRIVADARSLVDRVAALPSR